MQDFRRPGRRPDRGGCLHWQGGRFHLSTQRRLRHEFWFRPGCVQSFRARFHRAKEMIAHEKWRLARGLAGLWLDPPRAGMYDTVTFYPGSDTQTEWAMLRPITFPFLVLSIACAAIPAALSAQQPVAADGLGARGLPGTGGLNAVVATSQLEIHVQEPTGAPVEGVAVVTLTNLAGQFYRQGTTKAGYITFNNLAP